MRTTRRTVLAGLTALPFVRALAEEQPPMLATIIANHVAARGGAEALDRVKSAAIDLAITEGGSTAHAHYIASVERLARIDIVVGGKRVYSEGLDKEGVWLWPGDEPKAKASVAEGSANALLHGIEMNLVGLHRFEDRGSKLALMPDEAIDGTTYRVIAVTFATGHITYLYIDPSTWLIMRKRDERAYHPDVNTTQQHVETRFADFRATDGILTAERNEDYDIDKNALLSTNQVLKRVYNPTLPDGVFDRAWDPVAVGAPK